VNYTEKINSKSLKALNKLSLFEAKKARIESVYTTKSKLGRYGITPELQRISEDNQETDQE
jgi:hypothetical protein